MNKKQEKSIVDFFNTLKNSECENMAASVYYASPLKLNKTYTENDKKLPNRTIKPKKN